MEPITLTVAIITGVATATSVIVRQYRKIKAKNEEIESLVNALTQYSSTYAFEDCDRPMIEGCRLTLQNFLNGQSLSQKLEGKTQEEKTRIVTDLVNKIAAEMQVDVAALHIQTLAGCTMGCEIVNEEGRIELYLNDILIDLDPDKLVFVILHELRHGVQDSALRDDKWGFSDMRKAQWLMGNRQYVRADAETKFRAYQHQIVENDANEFAKAVLGL